MVEERLFPRPAWQEVAYHVYLSLQEGYAVMAIERREDGIVVCRRKTTNPT